VAKDTPPDPLPQLMNSTLRVSFGALSIIFFGYIIIYLIFWGKAENSLHQSALSWSFLGIVGILAAFGLGPVLEMIPYVFPKK
jgi:hypothetical protein